MPTISAENAKPIRTPFEVHCGLSKLTEEDLSFVCSGYKLMGILQTETELIELADLAGGGFPLDGSCVSYVASTMSDGTGLRSNMGEGLTLKVTCATIISAITIRGRGTGTISDGTTTYEFRDGLVFPFNAKTKTFTIVNEDEDDRIEIESIQPGIEFEFDNDSLISCVLSLRSDLSLINPSWKISEINISAYWPDDIATAISSMGDGSRIWYYAGYAGDRSTTRYFYLSEKADIQDNVLTLKGEDASYKLDRDCVAEIVNSPARNMMRDLYKRLTKYITDSGIKLRSKESIPAVLGSVTEKSTLIFEKATAKDLVASIMGLSHINLSDVGGTNFYPVFVDAGIPTLWHSKPASKWDIYEEDCGDVVRSAERNIKKIKSDDSDYGLESVCDIGKKSEIAKYSSCVKGKSVTKSISDGYYSNMTISPGKVTAQTANTVTFIPGQFYKTVKEKHYKKKKLKNGKTQKVAYYVKVKKKVSKGNCILYGRPVNNVIESQSCSVSRPGVTQSVKGIAHGRLATGSHTDMQMTVYPAYKQIFNTSNITGSFTWKGDPRMQPRDVFTFHRLDGTTETCTIESITLTHKGGGTSAEITYRKGVV